MRHLPLTRRTILRSAALATASLAAPSVRDLRAQPNVAPRGKMTLAWHTNIASRWLDPQQHDGTASPDNFLFAMHDALIKNFRDKKYDHLALAEQIRFRRGRQERDVPAARRASSSTTARRSRPRT